ncbi:MAG: Bacterial dynamin-like protein [Deltaproteobacteria bacterium ADurb.Bin510]|nr:MAG: Bacterial dynamin-like protein [Deltaproteobacteria bacterium ADurb.Bin510]
METELQSNGNWRNEELLEKIEKAASQFQLVSLNRQVEICRNHLNEKSFIDLAILGQFKAGKSSFINDLIGTQVLPVGVIPVTTVITRLTQGNSERALVTFFDGTTRQVNFNELVQYISETENPSNVKNVSVVDIEIPYLNQYAGIRLVDTPGMGSMFRDHMDTSNNWLPEVGAAVLAISAERPLSQNDLELLEAMIGHTPNISILLTKVDLLDETQQREVILFLQESLRRKFSRDFPIFLYSTRMNTTYYRQRFESELLSKLSANRHREFHRIVDHKMQALLNACISYLELALKASVEADQDRMVLIDKIINEKISYDQIRADIGSIVRVNQRQTRIELKEHLDQFITPMIAQVRTTVKREMPGWEGNLWHLTRQFETWLTEIMTHEIAVVSAEESMHFCSMLNKTHASLSRYLESFRLILNESLQRVLGIELADAEWQIECTVPEHPDIKVAFAFDIHLDLIWFVIPMAIFRKAFENHFVKQIPRTVETNLSRLAAQWEVSINTAIDKMRNQTLEYIKEELNTIESLLSVARSPFWL